MSHTCLSTVWQRYLLNVFVDICWLYLTQQLLVWVTFCCMMLKEAGVTSIRHSHCNWRNQQMRFKVKGICFCIYQINSDQLFTWISNVENKHLNIWFKILFRFVNEMFRIMLTYLICHYLNKNIYTYSTDSLHSHYSMFSSCLLLKMWSPFQWPLIIHENYPIYGQRYYRSWYNNRH